MIFISSKWSVLIYAYGMNTYILPNESIDTNFVFVVYFEFNIKNYIIIFGWVFQMKLKLLLKVQSIDSSLLLLLIL